MTTRGSPTVWNYRCVPRGSRQFNTRRSRALLDAAPELSGGVCASRCEEARDRGAEVTGAIARPPRRRAPARVPVVLCPYAGHHHNRLSVDIPTTALALKAGAVDDFVETPFGDDGLLTAIEAALVNSERDTKVEDAAKSIATLSRRERQVLDGLVAGQNHKSIAADLGISARTVDVHRNRMLERLGTSRPAVARRQAALPSLASGLISFRACDRPIDEMADFCRATVAELAANFTGQQSTIVATQRA